MAQWNGNAGGYPQHQNLYQGQHQEYYDYEGGGFQQGYYDNSTFQPSAEWCNPQSQMMVPVMPTGFQEFVPTFVYRNTSYAGDDPNAGTSSNTPNESTFQGSDTTPRNFINTGAVPKRRGNNNGKSRSYRGSHGNSSYRGGPNGRNVSSPQTETVSVGGETAMSSKEEDRKKLLAEVATLLNSEKQQNQPQKPQAFNQNRRGGGRSRRSYGGSMHNKQFNSGRGGNSGGGQNQSQWKGNSSRSWAATPNNSKARGISGNRQSVNRSQHRESHFSHSREPETQRERLTEQLTNGQLECLICCEGLRPVDAVWSCQKCYHILHLYCVLKWARTSSSTKMVNSVKLASDVSWRCPACQHVYQILPSAYTCFCGNATNPKWVKGEVPHCCGESCSRVRENCTHPCTLLCHPGPCPTCYASILRDCGCGRTQQSVICGSTVSLECDLLCGKILDCGIHDCIEKCHSGPCKQCQVVNTVACFCGMNSRIVNCGQKEQFACEEKCGKDLTCGRHQCEDICHPPPCQVCKSDLKLFKTCHCGSKPIVRESCEEPVPSCGGSCTVPRFLCSHACPEKCHPPPCPPCDIPIETSCRCGHCQSLKAPCCEVTAGEFPRCRKKCTRKRKCGKHKCNTECCDDLSHICPLPCNKTLSCGQHKCDRMCHLGSCLPCPRLSFDELSCECGLTVLYPPVECGSRLPECSGPCLRRHPCEHPPTHNCHSLPDCPPCTVLVSRECYGGHETRKAIPCYIAEYSCGLPCGKILPCGHKCPERCHGGECPKECSQPCTAQRTMCPHSCCAPCHANRPCPCPPPPCQAQLSLKCQCSHRSSTVSCNEYFKTYAKNITSQEAANLASASAGMCSTMTVVVDPTSINVKVLDCDANCKLYERNLKLAIGLQIANPDLSNKLKPQYNDFMKQWAKKDPWFCDMIHSKLTQLVVLAKESKQKSRSYSFEVMSASKRALLHEYCKHFGCESAAFDAEPKRNVIATAYKDKCWLPSYSLVEVLQRDSRLRRPPGPSSLLKPLSRDSSGTQEMVQLTKQTSQQQITQSPTHSPPLQATIDYFDFTPTTK